MCRPCQDHVRDMRGMRSGSRGKEVRGSHVQAAIPRHRDKHNGYEIETPTREACHLAYVITGLEGQKELHQEGSPLTQPKSSGLGVPFSDD